jgi:succinate dehydrogenase/fumarate reductase flavoprotein subunit
MREIQEGRDVEGGVLIDLSLVPEERILRLKALLPASWKRGRNSFIVSPTTHFCMGGIVINPVTETPVPGLFAAGEVCAGMHGANRLAGNALAEVFAMGGIAGERAASGAKTLGPPELTDGAVHHEKARLNALISPRGHNINELEGRLRKCMWSFAGIIRERRDLEMALKELHDLGALTEHCSISSAKSLLQYLEFKNMLLMSEALTRGALMREESRGSHFRRDHPEEDNRNWFCHIDITKQDKGMKLTPAPVSPGRVAPD